MTNCLIVEDNPVIRGIIAQILKDLNIKVEEAASPEQAVSYCGNSKPDVVLLDWDLPNMGALDFLSGIGGLDADLRPTIILSATENDPRQFTLAKAAGAKHHILKPFDKQLLAAKMIEIGLIQDPVATNAQSGETVHSQAS